MPYDVPAANSIYIDLGPDYAPICGVCLDIRLGDAPQVCEIWRPSVGSAIDVDLPAGYLVPSATLLDFTFQPLCYPEYGDGIILPCGGGAIAVYSAPAGNAANIDLYGIYVAPEGFALDFELADCALDVPPVPPPPWYQIPSAVSAGISCLFQEGTIADRAVESGWGTPRLLEPTRTVRFGSGDAIERLLDAAWKDLGQLYRTNRLAWDRLLVYDARVQAIWSNLHELDRTRSCSYSDGIAIDESAEIFWSNPSEKDQRRDIAYGTFPEKDLVDFNIPWGNPPPQDRFHNTCWGPTYYEEICTRDFLPPVANALEFNLELPINEVGDQDHVDVWFDSLSYDQRCDQREPSGWRDAYTYGGSVLIPFGLVKRCYVMNNLASVTRIADSAPVEVKSVTVATDVDSWCWSLSATPGSNTAIDLLDPTAAGAVEVNVAINGFTCIAQVDSWTHGRRFLGDGRQAGGRSLSAALAAPAAATMTYIEASDRTAQQIATDVLLYSGWTLDWQLTDWLIPGGVFSCNEQTPIQIIQTIAAAAGGIVQTHPETKTLIVSPRYPIMPWDWETATPDITIPEDMMDAIDGEWAPRPAYNAAFVSGTVTGGISMGLTRNGTAGDMVAPMVTDPLLTATEANTARGKRILAGGGNRKKVRCSLPVMTSPELPGVLLPGMLVSVTGVNPWRAMVFSVAVNASWGRALIVRQTVELWRYYGN